MDTEQHIRELLLRARDLEQEAAGLRAQARRLIGSQLAKERLVGESHSASS